jgi:hypothetical protein
VREKDTKSLYVTAEKECQDEVERIMPPEQREEEKKGEAAGGPGQGRIGLSHGVEHVY